MSIIQSLSLENLQAKAQKYFKLLLLLMGLVFLTVLGLFSAQAFKKQQTQKSMNLLYEKHKALKKLIKAPQQNPLSFLQKEEDLLFSPEMEKLAQDYEQALVGHKSFDEAIYFAMNLADWYYRYGKKEKAKALLSHFSLKKKKKLFFFPATMSRLSQLATFQHVSYLMEDSKECDKAIALLEGILAQGSIKAFLTEARMQKALCLQHQGFYDLAILEYKRIAIENPDTYAGKQAEDFEKILSLEKKLKPKK